MRRCFCSPHKDIIEDLVGTLRKIAGLMGIALTDDLLDTVVRQSSRDYMLAHASHFDERGVRRLAEKDIGLPFSSDAMKVTQGADKDRYRPSPEVIAAFDAVWRSQVELRTGLSDYDALRQAVRLQDSALA